MTNKKLSNNSRSASDNVTPIFNCPDTVIQSNCVPVHYKSFCDIVMLWSVYNVLTSPRSGPVNFDSLRTYDFESIFDYVLNPFYSRWGPWLTCALCRWTCSRCWSWAGSSRARPWSPWTSWPPATTWPTGGPPGRRPPGYPTPSVCSRRYFLCSYYYFDNVNESILKRRALLDRVRDW